MCTSTSVHCCQRTDCEQTKKGPANASLYVDGDHCCAYTPCTASTHLLYVRVSSMVLFVAWSLVMHLSQNGLLPATRSKPAVTGAGSVCSDCFGGCCAAPPSAGAASVGCCMGSCLSACCSVACVPVTVVITAWLSVSSGSCSTAMLDPVMAGCSSQAQRQRGVAAVQPLAEHCSMWIVVDHLLRTCSAVCTSPTCTTESIQAPVCERCMCLGRATYW